MENGTADSSSANGLAAAEGGTNAALSRSHTSSRLKSVVHVAHGAAELGDLAKTLGAVAVKEAEVELRGLFHHRGGANTAEYIVSVSRHKVTVGSSFIHEKHGLGKLSEITQNGDFVMIFDSGDSHTYQPKSIYKLRPVSEAQLKKMKASADGKGLSACAWRVMSQQQAAPPLNTAPARICGQSEMPDRQSLIAGRSTTR